MSKYEWYKVTNIPLKYNYKIVDYFENLDNVFFLKHDTPFLKDFEKKVGPKFTYKRFDPNFVHNIKNLTLYGKYSQNGDETIINFIFYNIGVTNMFFVEFGAGDGYSNSNTRLLKENGWNGLMIDGDNKGNNEVKNEFITAENINDIFRKYNVPEKFDFLSIDIDGNDYWVWNNLEYKPRVIIIEFNPNFKKGVSKTIKYNPEHIYKHDNYYGASFSALKKLGVKKGYVLVYQNMSTNMIFILKELVSELDYNVDYISCNYHKKNYDGIWVDV